MLINIQTFSLELQKRFSWYNVLQIPVHFTVNIFRLCIVPGLGGQVMINLGFLLNDFAVRLHTAVCQYSITGQFIERFCSIYQFNDPYANEAKLQDFRILANKHNCPVLCCINQQAAFLFVSTDSYLISIGPFRFSSNHLLKYSIESSVLVNEEYLQSLPVHDAFTLMKNALFLYNLFHNDLLVEYTFIRKNYKINEDLYKIQQQFNNIIFENQENETRHNPYEQELREFSSIEEGNLEQLKKSITEDYPGSVGLLSEDSLRHTKNLGIVIVTLSSRAAIRGGLLPEISFSLCDSYIQQIEKTNDYTTLTYLMRQAEFQYAQLVHDSKSVRRNCKSQETPPKVRQCKEYIFLHLHDKIFIQDIAQELQVNASYLAEVFKKFEGISISDFIMQEKIKLVKNLLIYSHYSYIEITNYLGFSSQSHMGQHFKQITGYTLRQFRNTFKSENFITEE